MSSWGSMKKVCPMRRPQHFSVVMQRGELVKLLSREERSLLLAARIGVGREHTVLLVDDNKRVMDERCGHYYA